jgi:hypothetical protein
MKDPLIPLILSAGAFLAVLVWRVRPLVSWRKKHADVRNALREAQVRIDAAPEGPERACALADAADILARRGRVLRGAAGLYARAMRSDPASVDIVRRAIAGLGRRPRTLESVLWRHLAVVQWKESPDAAAATLDAMRALYEGPLHNAVRARALANACEVLTSATAARTQ